MTILYIIGVILLLCLLFVGWGIFGWILRAFGAVFEVLFEGAGTSCGCIVYILVGLFLIVFLLAGFGFL